MHLYRNQHNSDSSSSRAIAVPALKDSIGWMMFCLGESEKNEITENEMDESIQTRKTQLIKILEDNDYLDDKEDNNIIDSDDGKEDQEVLNEEIKWKGSVRMYPSIVLLRQFDQVLVQRLINHNVNWLNRKG
jgi:hypothetical protein